MEGLTTAERQRLKELEREIVNCAAGHPSPGFLLFAKAEFDRLGNDATAG